MFDFVVNSVLRSACLSVMVKITHGMEEIMTGRSATRLLSHRVLSTEMRAANAVLWVSRHQWVVVAYLFLVAVLLMFSWEFPMWAYVNVFVLAPVTVYIVFMTGVGLWTCSKSENLYYDTSDKNEG